MSNVSMISREEWLLPQCFSVNDIIIKTVYTFWKKLVALPFEVHRFKRTPQNKIQDGADIRITSENIRDVTFGVSACLLFRFSVSWDVAVNYYLVSQVKEKSQRWNICRNKGHELGRRLYIVYEKLGRLSFHNAKSRWTTTTLSCVRSSLSLCPCSPRLGDSVYMI